MKTSAIKKILPDALVALFLLTMVSVNVDAKDITSKNEEIFDLNIEDLLNIEVTSVSKKPQALSDSPAAIFVITNEDLMRSGATSIPDALRMVPGLHVARIDSSKWAISSRGFNGRFANKLLVLIDGRSVYTPSFSGVYWEVQDTMLEDIERIEVIRGPGATLWGANAANGVINIITKNSVDTQGGLLSVGGGSREKEFGAVRYGESLGENTYGRIYAKGFNRDEFGYTESSGDSDDDWGMVRTGFRIDSLIKNNIAAQLQGDIYKGNIHQTTIAEGLNPPYQKRLKDTADVSGGNITAKWTHTLSAESEYSLKTYYDQWSRDEFFERELRKTFNLEFQHQFQAGTRQNIIWGVEYSYTKDDFRTNNTVMFNPKSSGNELSSVFMQDEITLLKDLLSLTIGTKFENNYLTDNFEIQPNARFLWTPHEKHKVWASVSRASRTPSRVEHHSDMTGGIIPPFNLNNPTPFPVRLNVVGQSNYDSETLLAYEIGYRVVPAQFMSFDVATFYNVYNDLRTFKSLSPSFAGTYINQLSIFENNGDAKTYGIEISSVIQPADFLKFDANYSYFKVASDTLEAVDKSQNSNAPRHQASVRTLMNLRKNISLDFWLRFVDKIKVYNADTFSEVTIDSYITLDARLAWQPSNNVELSIVGQNLFDDKHLEYVQESFTPATEIKQSFYGKITWRF